VDEFFKKYLDRSDLINKSDFEKSLMDLGLIPNICTTQQAFTIFGEIDISDKGKVTLNQVTNYF
jgi:hypothetical protein